MSESFVKRPIEIQAVRWDVREPETTYEFLGLDVPDTIAPNLVIQTLEGPLTASNGDWIIKGIQGEFYPCKPDIFEETYEAVDPDAPVGKTVGAFTIVEAPTLAPHRCLVCNAIKGPLVDTRATAEDRLRVYVCQMCAKQMALLFGWVEGAELERLIDIGNVLAEKERELDAAKDSEAKLVHEAAEDGAVIAQLREQIEAAQGRVVFLEHQAKRFDEMAQEFAERRTQPVEVSEERSLAAADAESGVGNA